MDETEKNAKKFLDNPKKGGFEMMSEQKNQNTDEEIARTAVQLLVAMREKSGSIGPHDVDRAIETARTGLHIVKGGRHDNPC